MRYSSSILHIIDSFLVPPQPFGNTSLQFNATAAAGAVRKARLDAFLDREAANVTLFVPNNDAFQRIGGGVGGGGGGGAGGGNGSSSGGNGGLADMSVEELARVLRYHVVNGTVAYSPALRNQTVLRTAQGGNVTITVAGNSVFVNSAQLLQQDILLANGVLHIIDK
jgi:uncharacterized surface protein with fasciclin (FAS1) repeats